VIYQSFAHQNNKDINKAQIQSVRGVADEDSVDVALIKRML